MQWLLIFKLLVLLTVANGAPVIATKLFGRFLNQQLDCGAAFIDGRSILGSSKTVRGIVLSIMARVLMSRPSGSRHSVQASRSRGNQAAQGALLSGTPRRRVRAKMAEVLCVYREVQVLKKAAAKAEKSKKPVAIVSYDEKPGIQAIATTAPDLPPVPGRHASFARIMSTNAMARSACWRDRSAHRQGPRARQGAPPQPRVHRIPQASRCRLSGQHRDQADPRQPFRTTTSAFAPILGFDWIDGFIIASAAMIGDLSSSFLKRRLNLPPSSRATGIDQVPECLLPAIAVRSTLGLTAFDVISVVIVFFAGELLLSRLLFNWNIRDRPY